MVTQVYTAQDVPLSYGDEIKLSNTLQGTYLSINSNNIVNTTDKNAAIRFFVQPGTSAYRWGNFSLSSDTAPRAGDPVKAGDIIRLEINDGKTSDWNYLGYSILSSLPANTSIMPSISTASSSSDTNNGIVFKIYQEGVAIGSRILAEGNAKTFIIAYANLGATLQPVVLGRYGWTASPTPIDNSFYLNFGWTISYTGISVYKSYKDSNPGTYTNPSYTAQWPNFQLPTIDTTVTWLQYGDAIELSSTPAGSTTEYFLATDGSKKTPNNNVMPFGTTDATIRNNKFSQWLIEPGDTGIRFGNPNKAATIVKSGDCIKLENVGLKTGANNDKGGWYIWNDGNTNNIISGTNLGNGYVCVGIHDALNGLLRIHKLGGKVGDLIKKGDPVYFCCFGGWGAYYSKYGSQKLFYMCMSNNTDKQVGFQIQNPPAKGSLIIPLNSKVGAKGTNYACWCANASPTDIQSAKPSNLETALKWNIATIIPQAYTTATPWALSSVVLPRDATSFDRDSYCGTFIGDFLRGDIAAGIINPPYPAYIANEDLFNHVWLPAFNTQY